MSRFVDEFGAEEDEKIAQSSDESENLAALLKIAIGQDLVSLVYQPIQNVASGRAPSGGVGAVGKWPACATAESLA